MDARKLRLESFGESVRIEQKTIDAKFAQPLNARREGVVGFGRPLLALCSPVSEQCILNLYFLAL